MRLPRANDGWFLIVFFLLSGCGLGLLIWEEIQTDNSGLRETVLEIVKGMEAVVVVSALTMYGLMEGLNMLAERYKRQKYKEGRQDERREILERLDERLDEPTRRLVEQVLSETREGNAGSSRQRPAPR